MEELKISQMADERDSNVVQSSEMNTDIDNLVPDKPPSSTGAYTKLKETAKNNHSVSQLEEKNEMEGDITDTAVCKDNYTKLNHISLDSYVIGECDGEIQDQSAVIEVQSNKSVLQTELGETEGFKELEGDLNATCLLDCTDSGQVTSKVSSIGASENCKSPQIRLKEELIHSPMMQEAKKIYNLVKDINKTLNQAQDVGHESTVSTSKHDTDREVTCKTDAGIQTSQIVINAASISTSTESDTSTKQDVMVQTSQVATLPTVAYNADIEIQSSASGIDPESLHSSQNSITDTEISEENISEDSVNSAVGTDVSSISEAQTIVVEMCHKEYMENEVVSDAFSSAVGSDLVGNTGIVELYSTKEVTDSRQSDLRVTENQTDYVNDSSVSEALVCANFETDQGLVGSSLTLVKEESQQKDVCTGSVVSEMKTNNSLQSDCSISDVGKRDEVICANDIFADQKYTKYESEDCPNDSVDIVGTVNAESEIRLADQELASYGGSDHECILIQTDKSVNVTDKFDVENIESQSKTIDMPNLVLSDSVEYDCDWTSDYDTEDNHSEKLDVSENPSEVESSQKSCISDDDSGETMDSDQINLVLPDSVEYQIENVLKNDNDSEYELDIEQETVEEIKESVPKSAAEKEVNLISVEPNTVSEDIEQSLKVSYKDETKDNRGHLSISELEKSCVNTSTLDIMHQPVSDFDTCLNHAENCSEIYHELNVGTTADENKNCNATEKIKQETTDETTDSVHIVHLPHLVCESVCDEPELTNHAKAKASEQFESRQVILKGEVSEVSKLSVVSDNMQGKSDVQEHVVDTEDVPNNNFLDADELTCGLEKGDKERSSIVGNSGKELLLESEIILDTGTSQVRSSENIPEIEEGEMFEMDVCDNSINEISSVESELKQMPTSCCRKDTLDFQEPPEFEPGSDYPAGFIEDKEIDTNQRNAIETVNEIEAYSNQSVFELIRSKHETGHKTGDTNMKGCTESQMVCSYNKDCTYEEETYKFVSPVTVSKYKGKDLYFDQSETSYTGEEKALFLEPDSRTSLSVETGLEVIALSIVETDEKVEAVPSVCISDQVQESKETVLLQKITDKSKYQVTDSINKSVELEDVRMHSPGIEVDTDMTNSCKSDNTVIVERQGVSLKSRNEYEGEVCCPKSDWDVDKKVASETKGSGVLNTRKRKMSDRDQDCAIGSDLPVKKVCPEHTDCVKNDHLEMKDSKSSQQRASELRNCMSNFFLFRDRLNRLSSRSPAKVRQQNIGRIVKRFFKHWSSRKKTYNILNSKVSLLDTYDLVDIKYKVLKDTELLTNSQNKSNGKECSDSSHMPDFIEDESVQVKVSDEKEAIEEKSKEIRTESETGHEGYGAIIAENTESFDELIQFDSGQKHLPEEKDTKNKQIIDKCSLSNSRVEKMNLNESVPSAVIEDKLTSQNCTDEFSCAYIENSNDNDSQKTNDSDLIVGHVSGVVRSSDVSFVDASVCYSDSDADTNYDFLFKTSMKKVSEHIASELPPGENKTDVSDEDTSHSYDGESDEIDIRSAPSLKFPATNYESDSLCHDTDTGIQSDDCLSSYRTLDIKVSENEQEKGVDCENEMLVEECSQFEQTLDNNLSRDYQLHDKYSIESSYIDKADDKDMMHGNEAENEGVDNQIDVSRDSSLARSDFHAKETVLCQEVDERAEAYENKLEGQVDELPGMQQYDSHCRKGIGTAKKRQATVIADSKVTDKQNLEDLSCRFSDTDDDDDFVSPVIDFSHLDEDSDDGLQCGQKDERSEQSIKCSVLDLTTDFNPAEDTDTNEETDEEETTMTDNETERNTKVFDNQTVKSDCTDSVYRSLETDGSNRDAICQASIKNKEKSDDDFSPDVNLQFKDDESSANEQEYEEMPFLEDKTVAELSVYSEDDEEEMPFFKDNKEDDLSVSAEADGGKYSPSDSENITKTQLNYCDGSASIGNACNIDKNILCKNRENTTNTNEMDNRVNVTESTEGRMRIPGKRKCSFTDLMSPKIARYDNKSMSALETVTAGPSCQEDATFKTPKSCAQTSNSRTETPIDKENTSQFQNDFCSTQFLCSSQQLDLDDLSVSQMTTVARQLEFKAVDGSRTSAMRNKAREVLARLRAKKDQQVKEKAQTVSSCIEEIDDQLSSSQERQSSIQSVRSEAQLSLLKDERNIQRFVS